VCVSVCVWAVVDDESTRHMRACACALSVEQTQACVCVCVCVREMMACVRAQLVFFQTGGREKRFERFVSGPRLGPSCRKSIRKIGLQKNDCCDTQVET